MKAKFNSAWIAVKAFVKKNAFSCACFLLAAAIFVTGSVSYAKYVTNSSVGGGASAGSFSVDATIDGVSALSFTNTEFWGTSSATGEQVAMNALHSVNFSVRNYEPDSNGNATKVSATRMKYNLVFSAPVNFAEKLALQVFDEYNAPMMPQIVVADLISAGENDTTFDTSNSTDYNGTNFADMKFTVTKNSDGYVATSGKNVIRLQKYQKEVEQSLMFRMWDTSALTSTSNPKFDHEGGQLQTPLTATYKTNVDYYRIVITLENFVLPAGTAKQAKHSVHLAPVGTVDDNYIGSTFVDGNGSHTPITSIYGGTETDGTTYKTWYLQSVWENVTDTFDSGKTETSSNNVSNVINYEVDKTYTSSTSTNTQENQTTGEQDAETTTTEDVSEITWKAYTVTGAPSETNYTTNAVGENNFVGITVREKNEWGTPFYLYKLPASRTGTAIVTKTEVTTKVLSQTVTDVKTDVEEEKTVISVSTVNGQDNVTMSVVRTTKVSNMGTQTVETTTTTTTFTRTFTETGYIYRAYYKDSSKGFSEYNILNEKLVPAKKEGSEYVQDTSSTDSYIAEDITQVEGYLQKKEDSEPVETDIVTTPTTTTTKSFVETTSTSENYTREIKRTYTYTEVQLTDVTWSKRDENGDIVKEKNEISVLQSYTKGDPLNFYTEESGVFVQKLYLSESYSKEYPFFVNVVFEQVLE